MSLRADVLNELLPDRHASIADLLGQYLSRPPYFRWQPTMQSLPNDSLCSVHALWNSILDRPPADERILELAAAADLVDTIGIVSLDRRDQHWKYRHLGTDAARSFDHRRSDAPKTGDDGPLTDLVEAAYRSVIHRDCPLYLEYQRRSAGVQRAYHRLILPLADPTQSSETLLVGFAVDDPLQLLLDTVPDAMIIADERGTIRSLNQAAERLFGQPAAKVRGEPVSSLIRLAEEAEPVTFDHFGLYPIVEAAEMRGLRSDGTWVPIEVSIGTTSSGGHNSSLVIIRDISRRKAHEATIHHLAYHDSLTGLANRAAFDDLMGRSMARARRFRTKVALALIDLDGFKAINDTYGHPFGDQVLRACADRLRSKVRGTDTLARLGGDEFALVQTDVVTEDDVMALTDRVITQLRDPLRIGDVVVTLAASVGVAIFPDHGDRQATLVERADAALYDAKNSGGGTRLFSLATPWPRGGQSS